MRAMARTTKIISISTLPKDLRMIDRAAKMAALSRSEFFVAGATRLANLQRPDAREPSVYADAEKPK
jgi:uncharacterized protein (DUF1778 family)